MKHGKRERQEDEDVSPRKKSKKTKRKTSDKKQEVELSSHLDEEVKEDRHDAAPGEGDEVEVEKVASKKKLKKKEKSKMSAGGTDTENQDDSSTSKRADARRGRQYTVSIALPGSIVDNAQTPELKTYLTGQIARTAAVFCIDEIVIFDEQGKPATSQERPNNDPNVFLCRLLQYQETPQYLRKALFPMHRDLKFAGLLNPLDCPHHMRVDDVCEYREGVAIEPAVRDGSKKRRKTGSQVDCGMKKRVVIDETLEPGTRVTVKLHASTEGGGSKLPKGSAVPPSVPRTHGGLYWGYNVRLAPTFSAVFTDGPHQGGYDLTIGTSERGENVDTITELPSFRHLLVVFGGLKGLEHALVCDDTLQISDVSLLFHHYLNTCPNQGSRTIRTEEAIPISLAALRPLLRKNTVTLKT